MTCLILIITSILIILAADDAVTLDERIYGGANKIFELSNDPPLAMMIYGNSDFEDLPLENLIIEYKKQTDFTIINSVVKVKNDFLKYLHNTLDTQKIDEFFNEKLIEFKNEVKNLTNEELDYYCTHEEETEIISILKKYKFDFEDIMPKELSKKEKIIFDNNLNNIFLSKISDEISGIVIAGFDKATKRGAYTAFEMVLNTPEKVEIDNEIEEINIKKSCIKIFAQTDVIESFFNGIEETLELEISKNITNYVNETIESILSQIKIVNSNSRELENLDLLKENMMIEHELKNYFHNIKIDKENNILDEIEGMPKNELVNMAESLIKITRLKRIINSERVSVGNDVNSFVLSLKDGIEKYPKR